MARLKRSKTKRAYTLIELLIVISIIGILTTIVFVSIGNVRQRARDAQRSNDLEAINSAIGMYFQANGHYPSLPAGCGTQTTFSDGQSGWIDATSSSSKNAAAWVTAACENDNYISNIAPAYIDKLPTDPSPVLTGGTSGVRPSENHRGYIYSHYVCAGNSSDPSSCGNRPGLECYKIAAYNPENPTNMIYQNLWDPKRDGGSKDSIVDGSGIWAWAVWSQGCAAI